MGLYSVKVLRCHRGGGLFRGVEGRHPVLRDVPVGGGADSAGLHASDELGVRPLSKKSLLRSGGQRCAFEVAVVHDGEHHLLLDVLLTVRLVKKDNGFGNHVDERGVETPGLHGLQLSPVPGED